MRTMFLILIGVVFVFTMVFAVLIWRQTIKFEKSALAAKQRKEAYVQQLEQEIEKQLEAERQRELERQQALATMDEEDEKIADNENSGAVN